MSRFSKQLFAKKTAAHIAEQLKEEEGTASESQLRRVLTVRDLTALGIAAVIGAGIFSTVGKACFDGGPGVIFLFIITAVVCAFSALCYAEFASRIPIAGSAYTYSYAAFGEFVAWIIGWDLLMEYAIGNIVVAISWSSNLDSLLQNMGIHMPGFLCNSLLGVRSANNKFLELAAQHAPIPSDIASMHQLWVSAPHFAGIPLIFNIPALLITIFITWLVFVGIQESRTGSNLMVGFKLIVILLVIGIGFYYVTPSNWTPFLPNGMGGVMKGVSAVFFAYIGFDAISTTAEECKNPQRDLPKGMINSLIICTVLYVLVALVLTGMVNYTQLNTGDFLAHAFNVLGLKWLGGIVALSAIIATTSVLLVFQLGQPRIWMSMSRDGLLPPAFKKVHPKYKTPSFSTIVTGLLVGIPALFLDSDFVTDLTSIGTLFAFVLVCGGILLMPKDTLESKPKFTVPYVSGRFWLPLIMVGTFVLINYIYPGSLLGFFKLEDAAKANNTDVMSMFWQNLPLYVFGIICVLVTFFSITRRLSLIPVLGLLSCFYLMTELGILNWMRFVIWLVIGLVIYFTYGIKHSRLRAANQ
ncbi:MAG TPA: amino acid permease [Bacteroidia bacterium]|nr:amino acid permease [Bacteroidia bacterium]